MMLEARRKVQELDLPVHMYFWGFLYQYSAMSACACVCVERESF